MQRRVGVPMSERAGAVPSVTLATLDRMEARFAALTSILLNVRPLTADELGELAQLEASLEQLDAGVPHVA